MTTQLFKRSGRYFVGLLISKALNLILFVIVAKLLIPADFGSIIYYSTIITLVTVIADFGTIQWYQKHTTFLANKTKVLHSMLSARIVTFGISFLVVGLYLLVSQRFSLPLSLLLLFTLIPEALLSIFDGYYLEKKQPLRISIKQITRSIILVVCVAIFYSNLSLEIFALAAFVSATLNTLWFVPWKYFKSFLFDIKQAIKTLKQSSQYALLITTSYAYSRGDSLIIENTIGSAALGIYSAGYRYLEGLSLLPTALAQNLFHISAKKGSLSAGQLAKITAVMAGLGILAGAALFLSSDLLTTILLGPQYSQAGTIVRIFSAVIVLFFVNAPLSTVVQSSDLLKKFIPWGIANTLANLALNILLIPMYGVVAAAFVMLATEVCGLILNLIFVKKIYTK